MWDDTVRFQVALGVPGTRLWIWRQLFCVQQVALWPTEICVHPTCKIHSLHPMVPQILILGQHQLKVQNLNSSSSGPKTQMSSIKSHKLGWGPGYNPSWGTIPLKRYVICSLNMMMRHQITVIDIPVQSKRNGRKKELLVLSNFEIQPGKFH